jgi:hypothetical protein
MRLVIILLLSLTLVAQNAGPFMVMGGFMSGNAYLELSVSERTASRSRVRKWDECGGFGVPASPGRNRNGSLIAPRE